MPRRKFVLSLLLLALPLCIVSFLLFHTSNEIRLSPMKQERTKAAQERRGCKKELFMTQADGNRLELLLLSEKSRLHILPQQGRRVEVVEELEKMSCAFQEKLLTGPAGEKRQQIRTATAERGVYTYATGELLAHEVQLGLFQAAGHTLTLPINGIPIMKGVAESVSLRLAHGAPRFDAEKLKAQLFTTRPSS